MAGKKNDTPANYGRWDTFDGTVKVTSKNTPSQQRLVDEINAQRKKAAKQGSKKK